MTVPPQSTPYRVLARKYRPGRFDQLIGQEAMVRTLSNAINAGRIAHAYVLTGVRGVGKTTTARIIARALNCIGGPTVEPCGVCEQCVAIAEDRHVDVIEMDAASRTGVEDMRDLIEGVRYRPVNARYKVYIIDEVHMLSRSAFNALLKTLEEPPDRVIFVFATTELRKLPVTVLSRCQRFDLRRVEEGRLAEHFGAIAKAEGVGIEPRALALIARAADGSVRDGLSLLDQAIAHCGAEIGEDAVREMLGLADRNQLFDLLEAAMTGDAAGALERAAAMYHLGADPVALLQDLLELVHWVTRVKIVPAAAEGPAVTEVERTRGSAMAQALSMPVLTRAWQLLLKGLAEAAAAPSAIQAAEMVLVRLAFAAELPTPVELVRLLAPGAARQTPPHAARPAPTDSGPQDSGGPRLGAAEANIVLAFHPRSETDPETLVGPPPSSSSAAPGSFDEMLALVAERREARLHAHLVNDVHLVRFEPGHIEFRPGPHAPAELASRLAERLGEWTGRRWLVTVSNAPGAPTVHERTQTARAARRRVALDDPLVKAALEVFPGATIEDVRAPARPPDGASVDPPEDEESA